MWRDRAVKPDVALEFAGLEAKVTGAAWPLHGPLGIRVGVRPPGGGRVEFDGQVGVDPITAEGRVTGNDADLAPYQAYLPLPARIGGHVHFDLAVALPPVAEGRATVRGRAAGSLIDVRDGERTVMRVERAQATGVDIDWPRRVAVRDVTLQRPWVLLERDQGGALTLRVLLSPRAPDGSGPRGSTPSASAPIRPLPASSGGSTIPITVDHLVVADGGARTVDHRVAPPIALDTQRLTGRIDGLSTDPRAKPARLDMTGRVGADSDLALRGTVGSLGGPLRLDMNAELRGFAVPRTNPYLVQQVAWEARGGRLTTTVSCRIDGDVLDAKTDILLSQLEVARAGGADGAQARIGLPLGMIVALMKDRRGDIRLSLPVGGRLSDPRFDMSEALWSTVRNVAVKAITAPVSWIGRVQVGSDSRIQRVEVDPIPFAPGSATLAAEAQEQVARLAAFLEQVPVVRLSLMPAVSSQDRAALEEKTRPPGGRARLRARRKHVGPQHRVEKAIEDGPRRPRGPAPRSGARRDQEGRRRQRAAESGCPFSGGKRGRPDRGGPGRAGGSGPAGPPRIPSSTPGPDRVGRPPRAELRWAGPSGRSSSSVWSSPSAVAPPWIPGRMLGSRAR